MLSSPLQTFPLEAQNRLSSEVVPPGILAQQEKRNGYTIWMWRSLPRPIDKGVHHAIRAGTLGVTWSPELASYLAVNALKCAPDL